MKGVRPFGDAGDEDEDEEEDEDEKEAGAVRMKLFRVMFTVTAEMSRSSKSCKGRPGHKAPRPFLLRGFSSGRSHLGWMTSA